MKKILCFILSALLLLNTTVVYADDIHGGSSGDLDVSPTPVIPQPAIPLQSVDELLFRLVFPDVAGAADSLQTWWDQWFADRWKNDGDKQKDYSVSSDGSTVHLHKQFVDELNNAIQNKVYALDGYYLLEPAAPYSIDDVGKYLHEHGLTRINIADNPDSNVTKFFSQVGTEKGAVVYFTNSYGFRYLGLCSFPDGFYPYIAAAGNTRQYKPGDSTEYTCYYGRGYACMNIDFDYKLTNNYFYFSSNDITSIINNKAVFFCNRPIKVFYSLEDAKKYADNGHRRTYAPKLPSGGFSIPIKYINNSVSLPDINYNNITYENKTEVQIQNEYDTILNNYITNLNDFTDGSEVTPTPKPTATPTPTPTVTPTPVPGSSVTPLPSVSPAPDQEDLTSNDLLKKIYDQLVKLSDSVSQHFEKEETFEDKLSKYLESHDKKLDGIVDAIDKLIQGKEEGEEKGCKYDYTELSDFMTKLWNDSDQKFDQMVELLKENNEYQEKMLSTLNSIKNILLAQTVMDAFKNRSSETANKAKEKFPTSVPWDIALIVNAMDAEPKAPVFELPIKIERLNIDERITVDISSGEWEKLAKACRYMLSLLFVLFMVNLTRKLFFSKGDD